MFNKLLIKNRIEMLVDKDDDAVAQAIEKAKPLLSNMTFGGIVGYCSGAAAKKLGKALAVAGGISKGDVTKRRHIYICTCISQVVIASSLFLCKCS